MLKYKYFEEKVKSKLGSVRAVTGKFKLNYPNHILNGRELDLYFGCLSNAHIGLVWKYEIPG